MCIQMHFLKKWIITINGHHLSPYWSIQSHTCCYRTCTKKRKHYHNPTFPKSDTKTFHEKINKIYKQPYEANTHKLSQNSFILSEI